MKDALIFKDIFTYRSVSWSKDTSFNHMFIYNYMFIMQMNTDWRFSEAIHLLKCVGFIAKLGLFLVYISPLYTQTVFKLDLLGLVTNLQTVKSTLNKRNTGRNLFESRCNIARLNERLAYFSLTNRGNLIYIALNNLYNLSNHTIKWA